MSHPTVILLVKFKSSLTLKEVREVVDSRIDQFRALAGLTQKYYLQDSNTGEIAGLYLWESSDAHSEFLESDLRNTIAEAYKIEGEPRAEVFKVFEVLRDSSN